jgi:hypothetical protein
MIYLLKWWFSTTMSVYLLGNLGYDNAMTFLEYLKVGM